MNIALWMGSILTLALGGPAQDGHDGHLQRLVDTLWSQGEAPVDPTSPGSHEGFLTVVAQPAFLHAAVGPFDVYLYMADGLAKEREAAKQLKQVVAGLEPLLPVMQRHFGGEGGDDTLVAGHRQPILLASSDRAAGERAFDQLVALVSWADDDWTGWKPDGNPIWTSDLRGGLTVRTWEAQVFNLGNDFAVEQGKLFLAHGLGYYTLAHVAARVLRQGAWGLVPPWLAQGIIDELDIEAYGEAWVGGDQWVSETPGWFRPGWSGFVPQGQLPPPPVVGPPKNLAVTVQRTGDSWQHRDFSAHRHWDQLVADLKSEAPASFAFMAEHESFLPRDRALARAVLHLLLHAAAPEGRPGLLAALDRTPTQASNGMFDSEPLPQVVSAALGGVPEVERLERLPLGELLETLGKPDVVRELTDLGAHELLDLTDHREQCQWLYRQGMPADRRLKIWNHILEAEYFQHLAQWKALGAALDVAGRAALSATKRYPRKQRDAERVGEAFWSALETLED